MSFPSVCFHTDKLTEISEKSGCEVQGQWSRFMGEGRAQGQSAEPGFLRVLLSLCFNETLWSRASAPKTSPALFHFSIAWSYLVVVT